MSRRKYTGPAPTPVPGITASSSFADRIKALQGLMASLGHPVIMTRGGDVTAEDQYKIWESGHTKPGPILTDKSGKPGDESRHQKGFATANDFAFVGPNGQPDYGEQHPWDLLGQAAKTVGLEWGGDWGQPYSDEIIKRYNLPPGTTSANLPGLPRSVGEDRPHVQQPRGGGISGPDAARRAVVASNRQAGRDTLASNEQPPAGPRRRDPSLGGVPPATASVPNAGRDAVPVAGGLSAPPPQTRGPLDQLLGTLSRRRGNIDLSPVPASTAAASPSAPLTPPLQMGPLDQLLQSLRSRRGDVNLPSPAPPAPAAAPPPMPLPASVSAPPPTPAPPPIAPPAAPAPAPVPSSATMPIAQASGDMITVGILPVMLGQEGTDPIIVTIPRATKPEDVQATAIAQAMTNAPKTVKLGGEGPQERVRVGLTGGPGQFTGMDFGNADVLGETLGQAANMMPQLAGLAAQFTPLGRTGYRGAAAVPAVIDILKQALTKGPSNIDPVEAAEQGAFGMAGHGTGNILRGLGDMGGEKVIRSLRLPPSQVGSGQIPEQAVDMLRNIATREGVRLTPESEQAMRAIAQSRGLAGYDELAEAMRSARMRGAVAPPRMTPWLPEAVSNWFRRPERQMAIGQNMYQLGQHADPIEGTMRALMAYLTRNLGSEPETPGPVGPRRRSAQ